jgi:hypothetical protein
LKFEFVKTSLNEPIKRVIEEMKGFMPEKKIKFLLDLKSLPVIEVDPDRVMQVLRNLLNNAVKSSKNNAIIWINVGVKGNFIVFSVKDEGIGIKKEDQVKIFEPFFQVGGMYNRQVGGTGLGLVICKGIVESQNGKIWFESAEGKGTTFYFTIPLVPVKEMKPIKVLFSNKELVEPKLKSLFLEYLGPLGEKEFESIKIKELTEEVLIEYINSLYKSGIIKEKEDFKNKVRLVLSVKTDELDNKKRFDKFGNAFEIK